ncbi:MAG: hypothetical protein LBT33_09335, partial [Spirochaetia bacterium]|nr:hypothetical protein [Spirochaetia bacterium]
GRIFVSATRIQKYCSPMQPGFLARERQKGADIFLNLLTVPAGPQPGLARAKTYSNFFVLCGIILRP